MAELRKAAGLTQVQLAERAGIAQGTLSRVERGESTSSYTSTVHALAKVLGCTPEYLTGDADAPTEAPPSEVQIVPADDVRPVSAGRPEWEDVLETLRAQAPDIPEWVYDQIARSGSLQTLNIPLTPASLEAIARVVLRHGKRFLATRKPAGPK